jgi:hypothetical protein
MLDLFVMSPNMSHFGGGYKIDMTHYVWPKVAVPRQTHLNYPSVGMMQTLQYIDSYAGLSVHSTRKRYLTPSFNKN